MKYLMMFIILLYGFHIYPIIHIFGDSHGVWSFYGMPGASANYIKGATMHRIGRDGLNGLNIKNHNVRENDIVIFVFGEIDVRAHIGKQRDIKNRELNEIIDTLVKNYLSTLIENSKLFTYIDMIVFAVLPPSNFCQIEPIPFYGSLNDRINITRLLNKRLEEECIKNNIKFLNAYTTYSLVDGSLNHQLSDKCVHVNYLLNKPIIEALYKLVPKAKELINLPFFFIDFKTGNKIKMT